MDKVSYYTESFEGKLALGKRSAAGWLLFKKISV